MRRRAGLVVVALAFALAGCRGEKLATAELGGPGTVQTRITIPAGQKLSVWADTEAKWNGPKNSKPYFEYDVELFQAGKPVGTVHCSTDDRGGTSVCGGHSNVMGRHSADCEYKLACTLPAGLSGDVDVKVTGRSGANVIEVTRMALNFRK